MSTGYGTGELLFQYFATGEARELRLVCRVLHAAVALFPWIDHRTFVKNIDLWWQCFPAARVCNVSSSTQLTDEDVGRYFGLKRTTERLVALIIGGQLGLSDAAFVHLAGIRHLGMYMGTVNSTISNAAFRHLTGILSLNMNFCNTATIGDAAFAHLNGIRRLFMDYCPQLTLSDAGFNRLSGIETLNMRGCENVAIGDAAFACLGSLRTLRMCQCSRVTITEAALANLVSIQTLDITGCPGEDNIRDVALTRLAGRGIPARVVTRLGNMFLNMEPNHAGQCLPLDNVPFSHSFARY